MALKGSKTEENLKAAFAGESQANRRYLYFAQKADIEGHNDVAAVFRSTAEGETGHAHGHLEFLEQAGDPATGLPIGTTRQNLEAEALKDEQRLRPADPNMSQSLLAQSRANQLYYYKQAPPQNYFSPGAWVQFLEAWKRGDYKKKPNQKKSTYVSPY